MFFRANYTFIVFCLDKKTEQISILYCLSHNIKSYTVSSKSCVIPDDTILVGDSAKLKSDVTLIATNTIYRDYLQ